MAGVLWPGLQLTTCPLTNAFACGALSEMSKRCFPIHTSREARSSPTKKSPSD